MDIKDVKLKNGMNKEEVNELISEWLLLDDDVYIGSSYKHNWKCKCGNKFDRIWHNIRRKKLYDCGCIEYKKQEQAYKEEVEKTGEYEYIRSFRKGDVLPNGKVVNKNINIKVRHLYCGSEYVVEVRSFINVGNRCTKCCKKYENSFAHYIEVELGEPLEKYWDFEKNILNPYHIYKNMNNPKVWIKCQEKDYHGSYEVLCGSFASGRRCGYCAGQKTNPKDSFAQYHIDNTDKDFLEKYWDYEKNTVDPFTISNCSSKKVLIKCQEKDYHGSYEISCANFFNGKRCSYCNPNGKNTKVHPYDSFGYHNFDKAQSWHPDNDISPFRVSKCSGNKYKFVCEDCGHEWSVGLDSLNRGHWCPECSMSKGEKKISEWLRYNGIDYEYDEPYFDDLLSDLGNPLRPDFILPDHKIWIEYDGEFHYKDFYKDGRHEILKYHDGIKDKYAKDNGWKLIRIPYLEFENIENVLESEI